MISKERINRPKMCFRVIKPRIISCHMKDQFYFILLFLFPFFSLILHLFLLVPFPTFFFCFAFAYFYFLNGMSSMPFKLHFSHNYLSTSSIRSFITLRVSLFASAFQYEGWSLIRVQTKKISSSNGRLLDNFLYQWRDDEGWSFFILNIIT